MSEFSQKLNLGQARNIKTTTEAVLINFSEDTESTH